MIDWSTETLWRCTCCNQDFERYEVAMRCHSAPVTAAVECTLCGTLHTAETARTATAAAKKCCDTRETLL